MSSTYGEFLKLSIFGQSHGPAIGMTLDGIPAGLPVDQQRLNEFMKRRAPGQANWSTSRKEADLPEFLSGIVDGYTCGAPIAAVIYNHNTRSQDYASMIDCPRPGHADLTAEIKYGGFQDASGGGHFSGRLTAPLCIAGGLCLQWLQEKGIHIGAHILSIGGIQDDSFDPLSPAIDAVNTTFPVLNEAAGLSMQSRIAQVKNQGDSIGGKIECAITGLPAGVGEPMFSGIENKIAQIMFGIPAVKGIDFGCADDTMTGSKYNDSYSICDSNIVTDSNHCGGILGGISNGMSVVFQVRIKPTPSISLPQKSISLTKMEEQELQITGRHDPCIVPRAVPVVEAAAAIAIMDLLLGNTKSDRRK